MARNESTIDSQGQTSIPVRIRQKLGLVPGSRVEWYEQGDDVIVRRATKYSSRDIHHALFSVSPDPHTVDEMNQGVSGYLRQKHARG